MIRVDSVRQIRHASDRLRRFTLLQTNVPPTPFEQIARVEDAIAVAVEREERVHDLMERVAQHDPSTFNHLFAVGRLSGLMALAIGARPDELVDIVASGLFHDIGKLAVPNTLLQAPRSLTDAEWLVMRSHTVAGEQILRRHGLHAIARVAVTHHERIDGTGYPYGIRGGAISLHVQIVTVADIFDTLTHGRPYARAVDHQHALDEIERYAGRHYAVELITALYEALAATRSAETH